MEFMKSLKGRDEAARKAATYQVHQRAPRIPVLKTEFEKAISTFLLVNYTWFLHRFTESSLL